MKYLIHTLLCLFGVLVVARCIWEALGAGIKAASRKFREEYLDVYRESPVHTVVASVLLALLLCWLVPLPFRHPGQMAKPEAPKPRVKGPTAVIGGEVKIPDVEMPKMPLRATASGPLDGMMVILDPGHGGETQWGSPDPGCEWQFQGEDYRESAYTFRMAKELGELIRQQGGDVAYTAWSPAMEVMTGPRDPMPLPVKALLADGRVLTNGTAGLKARTEVTNWLYRTYQGYRLVVFISLHIDSMGKGWSGLHVCHDRHAKDTPEVARLIAQAIEDGHYTRQYRGVKKEALDSRGILVINGQYNILHQRALVELGIPGDKDDSWRLRNPESRQTMLERVVVKPLIRLAQEH